MLFYFETANKNAVWNWVEFCNMASKFPLFLPAKILPAIYKRTKVGDLVIGIQLHEIFSINSRMVGHVTMTSPMINNGPAGRIQGILCYLSIRM